MGQLLGKKKIYEGSKYLLPPRLYHGRPNDSASFEINNLAFLLCREFERYRRKSWRKILQATFLADVETTDVKHLLVLKSEIINIHITLLETIQSRFSSDATQSQLPILRSYDDILQLIYDEFMHIWHEIHDARTKGFFTVRPDKRRRYSQENVDEEKFITLNIQNTILEEPVWGLWECLCLIHDVLFEENENEADKALKALLGRLPYLIAVARQLSNDISVSLDSLHCEDDLMQSPNDTIPFQISLNEIFLSSKSPDKSILQRVGTFESSHGTRKGVRFDNDAKDECKLKKKAVEKHRYSEILSRSYHNPRTVMDIAPSTECSNLSLDDETISVSDWHLSEEIHFYMASRLRKRKIISNYDMSQKHLKI